MKLRLLLVLLVSGCSTQDQDDQRRLRARCGLPSDATVVAWTGYPAEVGFGQREGLALTGTFRPNAGWSAAAAGYRPAPWPRARALVEQQFQLGAMVDGARALRCEAAGNNVLFAGSTMPCDTYAQLPDLILCAVEPSGDVRAAVRSRY